jgi:hypothetical protein
LLAVGGNRKAARAWRHSGQVTHFSRYALAGLIVGWPASSSPRGKTASARTPGSAWSSSSCTALVVGLGGFVPAAARWFGA